MKLSEAQIEELLPRAEGWRRDEEEIVRDFKFENFQAAMAFVNRVAAEAEAMGHHPDILIHGWNNVRLILTTHDQHGLSEKDFNLAKRVNQLAGS